MATLAFDVVTPFHALQTLEREFLGMNRPWSTVSPRQTRLFKLYELNYHLLSQLVGITAKASTDYRVLDSFLVDSDLDPMFLSELEGIGAVSIIDQLVQWYVQTMICSVGAEDGHEYKGFQIPKLGCEIYEVEGMRHQLVQLYTKSTASLWLTMSGEPASGFNLVMSTFDLMRRPRRLIDTFPDGVQLPMVMFNAKPDIQTLLKGATTLDQQGVPWYIDRAYQQFQFAMDHTGARLKVGSGVSVRKSPLQALKFTQPFTGFFTQGELHELPYGAFYADFESWKEPPQVAKS